MMNNPIIQVAGVLNLDEALMIAKAGVTHLGFPFRLDFHSEDCSEDEAAMMIRKLPVTISPVLITYLDTAMEISELMCSLGCKIVQLHGKMLVDELKALKRMHTDFEIWKSLVIHPENPKLVFETLKELEPFVDAFITDTFDPETGASGATGKTHDWNISSNIIQESSKPVVIAGGLHAKNVFDAIVQTLPAGVDVHTGVEAADGSKERKLVEQFVASACEAFAQINQA